MFDDERDRRYDQAVFMARMVECMWRATGFNVIASEILDYRHQTYLIATEAKKDTLHLSTCYYFSQETGTDHIFYNN